MVGSGPASRSRRVAAALGLMLGVALLVVGIIVVATWNRKDPGSHPAYTARLDSLREMVVTGVRPTLLMLLAAAALLFFVTCGNVAALLLARSVARARPWDSLLRSRRWT